MHKAARSAFSHHFLESCTERDAYIRQVDALSMDRKPFVARFRTLETFWNVESVSSRTSRTQAAKYTEVLSLNRADPVPNLSEIIR